MRARLAREARLLGAACVLLTRLPLRRMAFEADWLPRSAKYMPLVGAFIGLAGAATLLATSMAWPRPIPQLAALAAVLLLTGALHEDGLADAFDGFGGHTAEARLAIMKDSRLGTYGALALLVCLAFQLAALCAMATSVAAAALIGANAGARAAAILVMAASRYAADPSSAKVAAAPDRPRKGELAVGVVLATAALLPLAILSPGRMITALGLGIVVSALLSWRSCRALGGHTGDVLGATAVMFQTGFLVGSAALVSGTSG